MKNQILHVLKSKFPSTSKNFGPDGIFNRVNDTLKYYDIEDIQLLKSLLNTIEFKIYILKTQEAFDNSGEEDTVIFVAHGACWFNIPTKIYDQIWDSVPHNKFTIIIELLAISTISVDFKNYAFEKKFGNFNLN